MSLKILVHRPYIHGLTILALTYNVCMMIILRGGTIEQLTFILSEFRAVLAVTNPGRGSRQPHMKQI